MENTNVVEIKRKVGRPRNAGNMTNYNWRVQELDNDKAYCFMTLKEVTERYNIHRGTINLVVKNCGGIPKRTNNIKIEKIKLHKFQVPEEEKLN